MNVTTTLLSILGFFLFIVGFILVLAGVGIITIKQYVEITRGAKAFVAGFVIALLGALLLLPEARTNLFSSPRATSIADTDTALTSTPLPNTQPDAVTPTLTATQLYPTATPEITLANSSFSICDDISTYPGFLRAEPSDVSNVEITVRAGEIHAITAGTISIAGISLYGGQDRGSVVVLLPSATYNVTDLNPTFNWHGVFHLEPNEWESLVDALAAQQMIPGTCSDDGGCSIVDVLVVEPDGRVSQYEKSGPLNVSCSP